MKQALIVGASRGIGLGLADVLAERGWQVCATFRNRQPGSHKAIQWLTADINQPEQMSELSVQLAEKRFDAIVINAGVFGPDDQSIATASDSDWQQLFFTNAISPVRSALTLAPLLKSGGVMALMSSQLASLNENSEGTYPLYSASKAALNMLVRGLQAEPLLAAATLLSLHPGWVQTDMGGAAAPLSINESASGIATQLESWQGKGGHHYVEYSGRTLQW